jgi:hypothetical protein
MNTKSILGVLIATSTLSFGCLGSSCYNYDTSRTNELINSITIDGNNILTTDEGIYHRKKSVDLSQLDQSQEVQDNASGIQHNTDGINANTSSINTNASDIQNNSSNINMLNHSKASKSHEDWQDARLAHLRNHAHTNERNIAKNASWADQIQDGNTQGSDLIINEQSRDGANVKSTTIDMSGLVTNQGNQNAADIATNAGDIATNASGIATERQRNDLQDQVLGQHGNTLDNHETRITNNTINSGANSERVDQIQSGNVHDSTLSITEVSRTGVHSKTTDIDMSTLTTNQGNQNTSDIATNRSDIDTNTNNIATNRSDIDTNTNVISHNAGGVVDGDKIKSNKDLTTSTKTNAGHIASNYQSIQINAGNIEYEHNWNIDQQKQLDNLSTRADKFQNEIFNLSNDLNNYGEYMVDSAAGAMAVSTIDFGTVHTDELEIGVGVGMSGGHHIDETSFAAGVGFKYGIDEDTAAIAKGWVSQHGNYGAGAGVVFKY